MAAWVLAVIYLLLLCRRPHTNLGVFLLPLILGLVATAFFFADATPFAREPAMRVWGTIHAASLLLATVAVLVGFAAGIMYLGQAFRLRRKRPNVHGLACRAWNGRNAWGGSGGPGLAGVPGAGVLSGVVLNLINYRQHLAPLPWNDPVVITSTIMLVGLLTAVLVSTWYAPARRGRKIAYLTLATFVLLAIALTAGLLLRTQHGKQRAEVLPLPLRERAGVRGLWRPNTNLPICASVILRRSEGSRSGSG